MATLYSYKCTDCGLRGLVSGGKDFLMSGPTQTYYCPQAEALVDESVPEFLDLMPEHERSIAKRKLIPWFAGEPCPKCGGTIELDVDENGYSVVADAD